MTNELDAITARLINSNAQMIADAIARRIASTPTFELPDRPADRSRNGRRTRIARSRRTRTIL